MKKSKEILGTSGELPELGFAAAARALLNGEISSEVYVGSLLGRARAHADLKAFITIDEVSVLQTAQQADRLLQAGHYAPLLGVPLGVKDSYLTKGLITTFGTSVLGAFKPISDAEVVARLKDAGAIVFGKNNLVEMSYGLTGLNEHYGQVKNPYNQAHITGGSSSGAAASVAARIVPAALGGDTVGSIRVPASLCGVVGYKPTPGRWPGKGVAPISPTLDTTGLLARSVEDCDLVDALLTNSPVQSPNYTALSNHAVCSTPDRGSVAVQSRRQRRYRPLSLPEHASFKQCRRTRDQPSYGTECGGASTRHGTRCGPRA